MKDRGLAIAIIFLAIFSGFAIFSRADTVILKDSTAIKGVNIIGFKGGRLELLFASGRREMLDCGNIAIIRVDSNPRLNRAERLLYLKRYDESYKEYKGLEVGKNSWMAIWAKLRLAYIAALEEKVDEFARIYSELAYRIGDDVVLLAPLDVLLGWSERNKEKLGRLLLSMSESSTAEKHHNALYKLYKRMGFAGELKPLQAELEFNPYKMDQPGEWLDKWAKKSLEEGKIDQLKDLIEQLYPRSFRKNLPYLLYWRGMLRYELADYDRAALDFLRIVVEFPSSDYTPKALYYASLSAEAAEKPNYAIRLLNELIERYSNSVDFSILNILDKAEEKLKTIQGSIK